MTKLCPRGKAAAKRKFKVYPSAYANAYASKICAGKIKDPSGVKRKDFRGSKAEGGRIGLKGGLLPETEKNKTLRKLGEKKKIDSEINKRDPFDKFRRKGGVPKDPRINRTGVRMGPKTFFVGKENPRKGSFGTGKKDLGKRKKFKTIDQINQERTRGPQEVRRKRAGGGLMEATARLKRQGLGMGGSVCKIAKRGQNRDAIGKNS